jgi:hypothetical protein
MVLLNPAKAVAAGTRTDWRVEVRDAQGKPLNDLLPYMDMMGHAAFLNGDGTTFAHTHPTGTVSMAALNLVKPPDDMKMDMDAGNSSVTFPYGLPKAGWYRLIIQVRRPNGIETGFSACKRGKADSHPVLLLVSRRAIHYEIDSGRRFSR